MSDPKGNIIYSVTSYLISAMEGSKGASLISSSIE
jgi:hypothetical protein